MCDQSAVAKFCTCGSWRRRRAGGWETSGLAGFPLGPKSEIEVSVPSFMVAHPGLKYGMPDIFVSHIHEEERVAEAVVKFVRDELGRSTAVFLSSDSWQIYAGEIWLDRIREELASSKVVILMLSSESVKRPWVNFEAGAAWLTKKVIIPVCYGGLSKSSLPKPYSNIQALDLDTEYYYLIRSLHHHLDLQTMMPPPSSSSSFATVKSELASTKPG